MATEKISPISKDSAEHYVWGDRCDGWHLLKNSDLSVIQERMPAGRAEVRHYHRRAQQFFYILSGKAVLEMDGRSVDLVPGQGLWIPVGARHQMKNEPGEDVHFLVISQPPSHGDRVVEPEKRVPDLI